MEVKKDSNDYLIKIAFAGESKIGKTKLLERSKKDYNYSKFKKEKENYLQTIGIDFSVTFINFNDKNIKLQIWDTSGDERYNRIMTRFFRDSFAILLFYDALDRKSFEKVKKIYEENHINIKDKLFILIGNKYELNLKPEEECKDFVSDEEALEFSDKNNIYFFHMNAFEKYESESGINNIIELILIQYFKNNPK